MDEENPIKELCPNIYHDLITEEYIKSKILEIQTNFGINLSTISIQTTKPGEELFDMQEIQYKLIKYKCGSDFHNLINLIRRHGYEPDSISFQDLKTIAEEEDVILEGSLPGFAMVSGDSDIIFFSVSSSNAIEMAKKYAQKENQEERNFENIDDAVEYLKKLAETALLHEIGHILYSRIGDKRDWEGFIDNRKDISRRVALVQADKYKDESQIPIGDEAFADYAVTVLSDNSLPNRLGNNSEALEKVQRMIESLSS